MEYSAYEEPTVPICSFVLKNAKDDSLGYYYRLSDFKGGMAVQQAKVLEAQQNKDCGYFYEADESNFEKIPGSPIAYWVSYNFIDNFDKANKLKNISKARSGIKTGKNDIFIKNWWEVILNNIELTCNNYMSCCNSRKKWFPYNKGGNARNWYGNKELIVNFYKGGEDILNYSKKYNTSIDLNAKDVYFKEGITWTGLTSGRNTFRYSNHSGFDSNKGPMMFPENINELDYILAFLTSKVSNYYIKVLNPTLSLQNGDVDNLPIIYFDNNDIILRSKENINLSKQDWDSFETSWDFTVHPLVKNHISTVSEAYDLWKAECEDRFSKLKANEEELNHIFIDIYALQDELTPEVDEKDVTVYRVFDNKEDIPEEMGKSKYALTKQDVIKSFISYAVGCMLGRYSLDQEGLAYAGGQWDPSKYKTFLPDEDNLIPICDDEYFKDDIMARFVEFVKTVYGEETLEENLQFIADALGGKGTPKEVIRNYFLNDFIKITAKHTRNVQFTGCLTAARKTDLRLLCTFTDIRLTQLLALELSTYLTSKQYMKII